MDGCTYLNGAAAAAEESQIAGVTGVSSLLSPGVHSVWVVGAGAVDSIEVVIH